MMCVHQHMDIAGRKPWKWGGGLSGFDGQDCTLFAADWALRLTGKDPGDGIRGTYDTEKGAVQVLKDWGGITAFVETRLLSSGWSVAWGVPIDGDIAVVSARLAPLGIYGDIPAIRAGGLWVVRTIRGLRAETYQHGKFFRADQ